MNSGNSSNNNYTQNDIVSWIITIICLISPLWPLGLFLLLRKINLNKKRSPDRSSRGNPAWQAQQQNRQAQQQNWQGQKNQQNWQTQQQNQAAAQNPGTPNQHSQQRTGTYYAQQQPYAASSYTASKKQKTSTEKSEARQMPGKGLAVLLTLSAILLTLIGVVSLSTGIGSAAAAGLNATNLGMSVFGGFSVLGGVISTVLRGFVVKRTRRFQKYAAIIGHRCVMPIAELARIVGEPTDKARKNMQMMVDADVFGPSAYIDSELDSLVLSFEDAEKARQAKHASEPAAPSEENVNPHVAVINELHMLCVGTSDPVICSKIQRIEDVTVKIFRLVDEKPQKAPQIRRFMNYYLPTTLKLLHSYETLEKQGVDGVNISAAKSDIERVLDTLAAGFEQQLDNLFKSDKLDISADIDVLENLMRQDGLTDEGNIMRTSGGL